MGTPDPATRHPVTERSEVEVPRSDIVVYPAIFHPTPGQQEQPATKTPGNGWQAVAVSRSDIVSADLGPEGADLEDEAQWPRPWDDPQGKIYSR
ncbi:MAG: hypothetical protein WCJ93_05200 [Methanomicrobiales archaeon]